MRPIQKLKGGKMRNLVLYMQMSLDGYIAPADKPSGGPTAENATTDAPANDDGSMMEPLASLIRDADTLLLGRVVADGLLGYWLSAETDHPDLSSSSLAYARWAIGTHKAVISNTEEQLPWENSELLLVTRDEEMERAVSGLKSRRGKNIVVHGGVRTAQALARLNLVDEYQLVVHPSAQGNGKPLFKDLPGNLRLQLMEARELKAGVVFLRYRPDPLV
jgi:dihydrofolate reductase